MYVSNYSQRGSILRARHVQDQPMRSVLCRLCGKIPENVPHVAVLAGCSALAQNDYPEKHNATSKIVFFEILREFKLVESVPPW